MRLIHFIILIFSLTMPIFLYAQDDASVNELFIRANMDYREGNFKQAISKYESILRKQMASGELYYNLGNAYFKDDNLGMAMVNYNRAKKYIPRDPSLNSNIEYAESFIQNNVYAYRANPLLRWLYEISLSFSINEITYTFLFFYFVVIILIGVILNKKNMLKYLFYPFICTVLILFVSSTLFYVNLRHNVLDNRAIVLNNGVDVKFEPFINATTFFIVNQGQEVLIDGKSNGWYKISRPDGKQGWIDSVYIENI
jgi:tetratricopeptide (TPR) repeat protein